MGILDRARRKIVFGSRHQLNKVKRRLFEEHRLEHLVGAPGAWKATQTFQFEFLTAMDLSTSDNLLDVGCGPLRAGLVLIEYLGTGKYVGLDLRPSVVEEAERQIAKRGLDHKKPQVLVSSSFGRDELVDRRFEVVWAFQVLYHLEDHLVDECLAQVFRRLKPSGAVAYANVNPHTPSGRWKQFPFHQRTVEFYQDAGRRSGLKVEVLGELGDFGFPSTFAGHRDQMLRFTRIS
jgi:SAM-dependent methyltransferase